MENMLLSIEMMEETQKQTHLTTLFNKYLLSTYYAPGTMKQ